VSFGQQAHNHAVHDFFLTDNHLRNLSADAVKRGFEVVNAGLNFNVRFGSHASSKNSMGVWVWE